SAEDFAVWVGDRRPYLMSMIGAVDERTHFNGLELLATTEESALVAQSAKIDVFAVRWPVFRGVTSEGLLLVPQASNIVADVVALPDADSLPEDLIGLRGQAKEGQLARRLAENGCRVLIPALIDRRDQYSATATRKTNLPHREFIYRPAFEL